MSGEAELESAEARIAELPGNGPGLDSETRKAFVRARRRISRHHGAWRDGMPALETLFDDDSHRARALAGSLCTELEDVLLAWSELRRGVGPVDGEAEDFVRTAVARWRVAALGVGACHDWSEEGTRVFEGFVEDLTSRAGDRGVAALAGEGSARPLPPPRWLVVLRRMARAPLVALRRFLRPDVG